MKLADERGPLVSERKRGRELCASWAAAGLCLRERRVNVDRPGGKGGGGLLGQNQRGRGSFCHPAYSKAISTHFKIILNHFEF